MSQKTNDYIEKNNAKMYLPEFISDIEAGKGEQPIKTHFPKLDKILGGGLYAGMYVIGAVPGLGKTTFALQIADQIASDDTDMLIVSLEMAKRELIAKSVSREYGKISVQNDANDQWDKMSTRAILSCLYPPERKADLIQAFNDYGKYANHIFIVEAVGSISTIDIKETVKQHISAAGRKPVVVIDYLQLLAPSNERQSDKQNMDNSIMDLKRISRDFSLPVIAISSFNRSAYTKSANMTSVKESGGIEYSCDCMIGLQYKGLDDMDTDKESDFISSKTESKERQIELKILKNRNGIGSGTIDYTFYTIRNLFAER